MEIPMRILFCSYVFPPNIGGIETVSRILAAEFCRLGATVTVVTSTPGETVAGSYEVIRRPSVWKLLQLARHADIVFQNNISLKTCIPLLACRKPIVITHQGCLTRPDNTRGWQEHLKLKLLRFCHNIAISKAVADALSAPSVIIGNPFEPDEFAEGSETDRDKDLVFLGRLVSDKGCDLVLRALALLKKDGLSPSFTVVGDGPEMPALRQLTAELGLSPQVEFLGTVREGRGKIVARHKIMVVPSIWEEPFGVVALEGIAAGCAVIATRGGGLPEAVGPCGILVPNGDVEALAAAMKDLVTDASLRKKLTAERKQHLENFQPGTVAKRYMEVFASALNS